LETDWAKTVRSLRLRLRLKQGALAELIGVSQTYVSRLEAGTVSPPPAVAEALTKLAADPRTRSLFDDLRATVDHSPFPCLLVQTGHKGPQVEAISAEMSRDFMGGRARICDAPALARLISDLNLLARGGIDDGQILGASAVWADPGQADRFWQVRYTPIRDETGASFIHVTLAGLEDSPAARAAANDAAPRIERFSETGER
jgi:transcriptional regulator with XRE-family HTH domain